jgi:hypothetical protein
MIIFVDGIHIIITFAVTVLQPPLIAWQTYSPSNATLQKNVV